MTMAGMATFRGARNNILCKPICRKFDWQRVRTHAERRNVVLKDGTSVMKAEVTRQSKLLSYVQQVSNKTAQTIKRTKQGMHTILAPRH